MTSIQLCENSEQSLLRFSKAFKQDEKGVGRDWKALEEEKIKELFTSSKDKILNCLTQFRVFKIDP